MSPSFSLQVITLVNDKSENLAKKKRRPKAEQIGVQPRQPAQVLSPSSRVNGGSSLKSESSASALPSVDFNHNPEHFDADADVLAVAEGDFEEDFEAEETYDADVGDVSYDVDNADYFDVDIKSEFDVIAIKSPDVLPPDFVIQRYMVGAKI